MIYCNKNTENWIALNTIYGEIGLVSNSSQVHLGDALWRLTNWIREHQAQSYQDVVLASSGNVEIMDGMNARI